MSASWSPGSPEQYLDLSNAQGVDSAIVEAMPNHALALILDVSALHYLDSAGIHLIYKLREKLRALLGSAYAWYPARLPRQRRTAAAGCRATSHTAAHPRGLRCRVRGRGRADPAPDAETATPDAETATPDAETATPGDAEVATPEAETEPAAEISDPGALAGAPPLTEPVTGVSALQAPDLPDLVEVSLTADAGNVDLSGALVAGDGSRSTHSASARGSPSCGCHAEPGRWDRTAADAVGCAMAGCPTWMPARATGARRGDARISAGWVRCEPRPGLRPPRGGLLQLASFASATLRNVVFSASTWPRRPSMHARLRVSGIPGLPVGGRRLPSGQAGRLRHPGGIAGTGCWAWSRCAACGCRGLTCWARPARWPRRWGSTSSRTEHARRGDPRDAG